MNMAVNFKFGYACAGNLSVIDVCNFSSFGIRFSFAVSCEKVYHCVFSHSSSTSNECYVSCCSQNSLGMTRLRSISWCRHNDANF